MPTLSRVAIRCSIFVLVGGAALGAWTLAAPAFGRHRPRALLPLHVELLLFGWLVQLTMGVAHWISPRAPGRPEERARHPGCRRGSHSYFIHAQRLVERCVMRHV